MPLLQILRPTLPILIGASLMLTLSMGLRQSLGIFLQPLTQDIKISVSDFTLALAVQNLAWGFLQPLAGAIHEPQFVLIVKGEDGDVDFAHHGPQQRRRLERAQPLVAQRVGKRVDLEQRLSERIVAGRPSRPK